MIIDSFGGKMIKRLYNYFKRWDYRLKFVMVGCLNTGIAEGTYLLLLLIFGVNVFQNNADLVWQPLVANMVGQILGVTNSYLWNKFFTFESKQKSKSELVRFLLVNVCVIAIGFALKYLLRLGGYLNEIFIILITTVIVMVVNFACQKLFVFRHHVQPKNKNVYLGNVVDVEAVEGV